MDLDEILAGYSWIVPAVLLAAVLITDRRRPAMLLTGVDVLIALAGLAALMTELGSDWTGGGSSAWSFINNLGFNAFLLMISLYLYIYHEEDFRASLRLLSFVIWATALIAMIYYLKQGYLQQGITNQRMKFPYGHPIPAAHCWVMGLWMPLTGHRGADAAMKSLYVVDVFLTMSRSSWIAMALTVVLYGIRKLPAWVRAMRQKGRERSDGAKAPRVRGLWKGALLLAGAAVLAVFLLRSDFVQGVLAYRLTDVSESGPYITRTSHWEALLPSYAEGTPLQHLFGGKNVASDLVEFGVESASSNWLIADNTYVSLLYVYGLVMLSAVVLVMVKTGLRYLRSESDGELVDGGIMAMIGAFIIIFFYDVQSFCVTMLPMMAWTAVILVDWRRSAAERRDEKKADPVPTEVPA